MSSSGQGKGYGKIIVFGEHFVEYGLPAIASAIDKSVEVKAEKIKDLEDVLFDDKVLEEKVSLKLNPENVKFKILQGIMKDEQFAKPLGIKLSITSSIEPGHQFGYAPALSAAIARAVNHIFDLDWKEDVILENAYKGELAEHPKATKLGVSCAVRGTTIWFESSNKEKTVARTLKVSKPLLCLVVTAPNSIEDSELAKKIEEYKQKEPKKFDILCSDYKTLVGKVKTELQFGGIETLGKLMTQNNNMLKQLGASTKEVDEIVKLAQIEGTHGAKICGHGTQNVLILCINAAQQDKLIGLYQVKGYTAIKVKVN